MIGHSKVNGVSKVHGSLEEPSRATACSSKVRCDKGRGYVDLGKLEPILISSRVALPLVQLHLALVVAFAAQVKQTIGVVIAP